MSDTAALHERLLAVEKASRAVLIAARNEGGDVPLYLAMAMATLNDEIVRLDNARDAVRARQKLEGRWTG